METLCTCEYPDPLLSLETFLGGMETGDQDGGCAGHDPLKPSLVEWKPCFFWGKIIYIFP